MSRMKNLANDIYLELGFDPSPEQMKDFFDFLDNQGINYERLTCTEVTHILRLWQGTWQEWPEGAVLHKIKKMIPQLSLMALADDLIPTLQAELSHRIDGLLTKEVK